MRIISKLHDYYDRTMAYGTDERVIFMREEVELDREVKPDGHMVLNWLDDVWCKHGHVGFEQINIGLCGKMYRAIQVKLICRYSSSDRFPNCKVFYDHDELMAYVTALGVDIFRVNDYPWMITKKKQREEQLKAFFGQQGQELVMNFMIDRKLVVFTHNGRQFLGNTTLKELEFYRVMDAYQAYQEIDMFVSGTLPQSGANVVEIEDKYRIPQHGFDKFSFKHRPK